jgi:hypothetical protein
MSHIVGIDTKTLFLGNTTLINIFKFLIAVSHHNQKRFIFRCARISTRFDSIMIYLCKMITSYKLALFSCVLEI